MTATSPPARTACYHARIGRTPGGNGRYGQRVTVLAQSPRGTHPHNVLVQFADGAQMVTSIGCIRWKCERHKAA